MKKFMLLLMLTVSTFTFSQTVDSLSKEQPKKVLIYNESIIKKYGIYYGGLIIKNKICVGMSKEAVIESWGKPTHIYKITSQLGVYEQWFYSMKTNYGLGAYLYFENNHLSTISQ